jgi:hypothetical protein
MSSYLFIHEIYPPKNTGDVFESNFPIGSEIVGASRYKDLYGTRRREFIKLIMKGDPQAVSITRKFRLDSPTMKYKEDLSEIKLIKAFSSGGSIDLLVEIIQKQTQNQIKEKNTIKSVKKKEAEIVESVKENEPKTTEVIDEKEKEYAQDYRLVNGKDPYTKSGNKTSLFKAFIKRKEL